MCYTGNVNESFVAANFLARHGIDGLTLVEAAVFDGDISERQRGSALTGRAAVPQWPEQRDVVTAGGRLGAVVKPVDVGRRRAVPGHAVQPHRRVDEHWLRHWTGLELASICASNNTVSCDCARL